MLETSAKFLKGVYSGDTLYPALEIVELIEQNTTGVMVLRTSVHNQKDELCLEGELRCWLPNALRSGRVSIPTNAEFVGRFLGDGRMSPADRSDRSRQALPYRLGRGDHSRRSGAGRTIDSRLYWC